MFTHKLESVCNL